MTADGSPVDGETAPGTDTDTGTVTPDATRHEGGAELERTIGLTGGLSIGVGTMIGAGIFVFPGLAAGRAGPAAAASFAIGAVIALLVALPTAELATAMPRSGGGYYFISRGMGAVFGAIVGISLWLGLVFASAFYLVGLGEYAVAALAEAGVAVGGGSMVVVLGIVVGIGLTAMSITGTENTATLQNVVVGTLLLLLSVFLFYGLLDAVGVFGRETVPEQFAPAGYVPIMTTAALVFTSYLGFAQVATVAGEITEPGRNLPLAMVGSVVIVGVFYVLTIFVATSAIGSDALEAAGETAIVEVARAFFGLPGAVAILLAGLLATLSSANASILSASRALYALSRDLIVPREASRINLRYGTPHIALALVGGPVIVLVSTGRTALLAEVASFLHLIMYGLICVALIVLRRRDPDWYEPDFTVPGYPAVPVVGAVSSFGLIAFMQPTSRWVGVAIMLAALGWYAYYARDVRLKRGETDD
ncbi:APC family permease [Natrialbaceae archaeon A-CW3]